MRNVKHVTKDQLQRVLAGRQFQSGLSLALAKVYRRITQWLIEWGKCFLINQQMVVPGSRAVSTGWCHTHSFKSEDNGKLCWYRVTVFRRDDVYFLSLIHI